jgi:phosphatidylinositol glycan class O
MVWKIFAPRFIFEGVGFCVSAAAVLDGYACLNRFIGVLSKYYRSLEKEK